MKFSTDFIAEDLCDSQTYKLQLTTDYKCLKKIMYIAVRVLVCHFLYIQTGSRSQLIYTNGCYGEFEELIENVLPILGGILLGIFVLEVR